jgi:uncharacterized membrane protein YhhN
MGEIYSGIVGSPSLHWISKPLIMVTLGLYYFFNATYRSTVVWLAIFFSFLGDTTLMLESRDSVFFMVGLSAFLIAHIFYILSYGQYQDESEDNALKGIQKIRIAFPIILAGTGLLVVLYPTLGDLKIPVVIYALVLIVMVLNAVFRFGRTNNNSFWLVFGGSLLFMISDSLLAINKFLTPVPSAGVWIMSSYMLAQFLIIQGLCVHVNNQK